jgi:UDPglucose 6-dehydrogenase
MKITLFGAGYVGLVTGACFAEMGNEVLCIDVDTERVAALGRGIMPIYEPGLERLVARNCADGRLAFSADPLAGVDHGEVLFIAVGTPASEDGGADLSHVLAVARTIGRSMTAPKTVVDKSTVPVGTADQVRAAIGAELEARGVAIDFDVAANPEFLKEGGAVSDFMKPDRIVIGAARESTRALLERLYAPFNRNHDKVVHMDVRSAELTKYAANVMLATRISLMNELANLADRLGADIEAVRRGIGTDPRIGYHFIYAGAGYGGSCFPKDVRALIHSAEEVGFEATLTRGVQSVNERQKHLLFEKVCGHYGDPAGRTFALWGLAFKPNTDDMREAPSRVLIDALLAAGATVRAYDPAAGAAARRLYGDRITVCMRRDEPLPGADGLIVATEWNEFRSPDLGAIRRALKEPVVFDGRNLYDPQELRDAGLVHYGIGRGTTG